MISSLMLRAMFVDIAKGTFDPDSKTLGKEAEKIVEIEDESDDEMTEDEDEEIMDSVASTTAFLLGRKIMVDSRWYQHHDSGQPGRTRSG